MHRVLRVFRREPVHSSLSCKGYCRRARRGGPAGGPFSATVSGSDDARHLGVATHSAINDWSSTNFGCALVYAAGSHPILRTSRRFAPVAAFGLAALISGTDVERRKKRALERIASFAARLFPSLDAERPNDPIELSTADLTLRVKGVTHEYSRKMEGTPIGSRTRSPSVWACSSSSSNRRITRALLPRLISRAKCSSHGYLLSPQRSMGDPAIEGEDMKPCRRFSLTFTQVTAALQHVAVHGPRLTAV